VAKAEAMTFQTLFDDDSLTAADGPYVRLMKMRKWLFLNASLLAAVKFGWLSLTELSTVLSFVRLPRSAALAGLALSEAYLLVMFGASFVQYWLDRRSIVAGRFTSQSDLTAKAVRAAYEAELAKLKQESEDRSFRRYWNDETVHSLHQRELPNLLKLLRRHRPEDAILLVTDQHLGSFSMARPEDPGWSEFELFKLDLLGRATSLLEGNAFVRTRSAIAVENFIDGTRMLPAVAAALSALVIAVR
jgi:hypothetical protein